MKFRIFVQTCILPNSSRIILAVLLVYSTILFLKNHNWENPKMLQHDPCAYYAYLPAVIIQHDHTLSFIKESDYSGVYYWSQEATAQKGRVIKMTMGLALMHAPFFLMAHGIATLGGFEATGYTPLYYFFLTLGTIVYLFAGLLFLRALLRTFCEDYIVALVLATLVLGTNLQNYVYHDNGMTHAYSFALISAFLWLTIKWYKKPALVNSIMLGLVWGLITLIRPVNSIVVLFFLLYGVGSFAAIKERILLLLKKYMYILLAGIAVFLVLLPQILYWHSLTGNFMHYSYAHEKFYFLNPRIIDGLFSFRKGWFVYTPVMLFVIPGIIISWKSNRAFFWPVLLCSILIIYVVFCWWTWWYGGSFGCRPLIDFYAMFAIPMAICFQKIFALNKWISIAQFVLIVAFCWLNLFQTWQYSISLLHWDAMTARAYFAIWGQEHFPEGYDQMIDPPDYDNAMKGLPE